MRTNSALTLSQAAETKWTVISGPMKGSVRLVNQPSFTVGRSSECEFAILNDPNCSRRHATIQWTAAGFEVTSLNESNLVQVNGKPVQKARLNDNDVVTFGGTQAIFNLTNLPSIQNIGLHAVPAMAPPPAYPPSPYNQGGFMPPPQMAPRPMYRAPAPKVNHTPKIIIGVVLVLGYWIFSGEAAKKKEEIKLRTEQQAQADVETATKLEEAARSSRGRRLDESVTGKQAQENYVRGFRDYRKGQYERALESFQACLALNPKHALCNLYTRLSQRKFTELVQYHIVLGRRYRDQNQFQSCRSSFRNVMVMVKDANSPAYKEAKANYDACNSMVEGHF